MKVWCLGLISMLLGIHCGWSQNQTDSTNQRQTGKSDPAFVTGVNQGGIWAHSDEVSHLAQSHPTHYFLEIHFRNPQKNWHRKMGKASAGVAAVLVDYRNPTLGHSFALIPFLEPRIRPNWSFRIGTGFAWNFQPFSLQNHQNLMLGSNLTMVMHGQTNCQPFAIRKKKQPGDLLAPLRLGIGLTHFSNGAFQVPNLGVNLFFLSLGYGFGNALKGNTRDPEPTSEIKKTWSVQLSGSFSLVQKFPVLGPRYPVYQIQSRLRRTIGYYSSLSLGVDGMYNASYQALIREDSTKGSQAASIGIPIGHELRVSERLRLLAELGWYAYKNHSLSPALYQRYGLRYFWNTHIYNAIYLKAHKGKAECLEWNLGWEF